MKKDETLQSLGEFKVVELDDASLEQVWGGEEENCGCHGGECNQTLGCGPDIDLYCPEQPA